MQDAMAMAIYNILTPPALAYREKHHVIGRMPIAYRGKDERVERVLMYYCTSSLLALVQDAAEEPSTYCFADTLETKRDALSARRGSCQKSEKLISTPCVVFRDRDPL